MDECEQSLKGSTGKSYQTFNSGQFEKNGKQSKWLLFGVGLYYVYVC